MAWVGKSAKKRFIVFAGDHYYPEGGWSDLFGSSDTKEEAIKYLIGQCIDWWEIVDRESMEMVDYERHWKRSERNDANRKDR